MRKDDDNGYPKTRKGDERLNNAFVFYFLLILYFGDVVRKP